MELCNLANYKHAGDMLVVYLPKGKILAEPDAFTPPGMATAPFNPPAVIYAQSLVDNIQRLKLDVQTVVPFHGGRTAEWAEVTRDAARATSGSN